MLRCIRLRHYCSGDFLQSKNLQDQQETVGIQQQLPKVMELHHVYITSNYVEPHGCITATSLTTHETS